MNRIKLKAGQRLVVIHADDENNEVFLEGELNPNKETKPITVKVTENEGELNVERGSILTVECIDDENNEVVFVREICPDAKKNPIIAKVVEHE